jgi:hypothetical protein
MAAFAEGYDTTRVTREVLPGATTVLRFELAPALQAPVESGVENSLVRIRFMRGGEQVCTNGLIARANGLILTSYGPIRDASGLEILRGPDVYGVTIAARDPDRDLAVLHLNRQGLPVLPSAADVSAGQYVWSVHHRGCGPATSARSRLAGWPRPPTEAAFLDVALPAEALGAPLIDRSGGLLGMVVAPDRVVPMTLAERVLQEAVADLVAGGAGGEETQVGGAGGGGFPLKWVGAGAAAVGVAALLLGGGGGKDKPPAPTTGGIIITFPGGAP